MNKTLNDYRIWRYKNPVQKTPYLSALVVFIGFMSVMYCLRLIQDNLFVC